MFNLKPDELKKLHHEMNHILKHDRVQEMGKYIQHGTVNTLSHCMRVMEVSCYLNRRLHLKAKEKTLHLGALLHDFYLYDWHDGNPVRKTHGYDHADIAKKNAIKYFKIDKPVQDIIHSHMWPLNLTRIPKSREALIVCLADKYVSTIETLFKRK